MLYADLYYLGTGFFTVNGIGEKFHFMPFAAERDFPAEITVFFISMQTVIGPTPPGTGLM